MATGEQLLDIPEQQDLAVGLVVQAIIQERERCAKIAESWADWAASPEQQLARDGIAAAIRSGK